MAPKIKVTEEDILTAAVQLIREKGVDALQARMLAERLGCSVQPLFRVYGSMEMLKAAVEKHVEAIYNEMMFKRMTSGSNGFQEMGLAYVNFARTDPNLFKLLFMSNAFTQSSAMDIAGSTEGDDQVIALIARMTGLDSERAKQLYSSIWFTTHGIASLLATNSTHLSDDEVRGLLTLTYTGLLHVLKNEREGS